MLRRKLSTEPHIYSNTRYTVRNAATMVFRPIVANCYGLFCLFYVFLRFPLAVIKHMEATRRCCRLKKREMGLWPIIAMPLAYSMRMDCKVGNLENIVEKTLNGKNLINLCPNSGSNLRLAGGTGRPISSLTRSG